jgi:hypothetical protein
MQSFYMSSTQASCRVILGEAEAAAEVEAAVEVEAAAAEVVEVDQAVGRPVQGRVGDPEAEFHLEVRW